jgi:hypothetical protein
MGAHKTLSPGGRHGRQPSAVLASGRFEWQVALHVQNQIAARPSGQAKLCRTFTPKIITILLDGHGPSAFRVDRAAGLEKAAEPAF